MANGTATMSKTATLNRAPTRDTALPSAAASATRDKDDKAMLKAAANLTRDLNVPNASIYWADMIGSALLGYVRRRDYSIFVAYRLIAAAIVLLLILTGVRSAGF